MLLELGRLQRGAGPTWEEALKRPSRYVRPVLGTDTVRDATPDRAEKKVVQLAPPNVLRSERDKRAVSVRPSANSRRRYDMRRLTIAVLLGALAIVGSAGCGYGGAPGGGGPEATAGAPRY